MPFCNVKTRHPWRQPRIKSYFFECHADRDVSICEFEFTMLLWVCVRGWHPHPGALAVQLLKPLSYGPEGAQGGVMIGSRAVNNSLDPFISSRLRSWGMSGKLGSLMPQWDSYLKSFERHEWDFSPPFYGP